MTITLNATPGDASANAYVDLAGANSLLETRGFATEWTDADDEKRKAALVWATRILERLEWDGGIASTTQALRWPRFGAYDEDGREFASNAIPKPLKDATAELALYLVKEDRTEDQGTVPITEAKVGEVAVKFGVGQAGGTNPIPQGVLDMVAPLLRCESHGMNVPLVRR